MQMDSPETPAETPSDTTVTLPTPDSAHAQLACHNPPRFIFYPISWDGSDSQSKKTPTDDQLNSPSVVFCSSDAFWSIDRWRRDVVKCGGDTADLLDPIHDADTPLPLLSLPDDHHGSTQPAGAPPRGTESNASEGDSVQLWIHP